MREAQAPPRGSNGAMKEDTHKSPDMTRLTLTRRERKREGERERGIKQRDAQK